VRRGEAEQGCGEGGEQGACGEGVHQQSSSILEIIDIRRGTAEPSGMTEAGATQTILRHPEEAATRPSRRTTVRSQPWLLVRADLAGLILSSRQKKGLCVERRCIDGHAIDTWNTIGLCDFELSRETLRTDDLIIRRSIRECHVPKQWAEELCAFDLYFLLEGFHRIHPVRRSQQRQVAPRFSLSLLFLAHRGNDFLTEIGYVILLHGTYPIIDAPMPILASYRHLSVSQRPLKSGYMWLGSIPRRNRRRRNLARTDEGITKRCRSSSVASTEYSVHDEPRTSLAAIQCAALFWREAENTTLSSSKGLGDLSMSTTSSSLILYAYTNSIFALGPARYSKKACNKRIGRPVEQARRKAMVLC